MASKTLAEALLEAQTNIGTAIKGADNPFYSSKYADLGEVIKTVKEECNKAGLTITQPLEVLSDMEGKPYQIIRTVITHGASGEFLDSKALVPEQKDMQKLGAAITYLRRYTLQSMLLVPAMDDDANSCVTPPKKAAAPTKRKVKGAF